MGSQEHVELEAASLDEIRGLGFDPERLARVKEKILSDIGEAKCHGVSMIAARRGKVVLAITEGYADRENDKTLATDSIFVTMSVAKQFTNVLALSLVEKGLLKLHAPVAEVIPEFATLGKEKVNLYHLLTHTSGLLSAVPAVAPDVLMNIERLTAFR